MAVRRPEPIETPTDPEPGAPVVPTVASVLAVAPSGRLLDLCRLLGCEVRDLSFTKERLVSRLATHLGRNLPALLRELGRDELRAVCRRHKLDSSSRSRTDLQALVLQAAGMDPRAASVRPPATTEDGLPTKGQVVHARHRQWLVEEVVPAQAGESPLVRLVCLDDDDPGRSIDVLWELELGARVVAPEAHGLGEISKIDPPSHFGAYLHALKWSAVSAADATRFQAPFRAGIKLMAHQLTPLLKALELPRANLFIADDVGLGKTIEAGLVLQELLLRQQAGFVLIVCPASVCLQWQGEMQRRFGLRFEVMTRQFVAYRRQERGFGTNPWSTHNRFIVSHALLRRPEHRDPLLHHLGERARKGLLILDEAHAAAPASASKYATDTDTTKTIRDLAPRFDNRLFLSATPHNGHSNSFSALLEILDPVRFTRGVPVEGKKELDPIMVRRLKRDLRQLGVERFPRRLLVELALSNDGGAWRLARRSYDAESGEEASSLEDPKHPDRRLAELIYFPTGGGKTEAYLGVIAFALLLRRIRGQGTPHEGRGVAVLLRYTLRLLTLDQLGRAATLMCALEELRKRNPKELGNARFTVGLWVGASASANRLKEVHEALSDYSPGRTDSPFPLTTCPWCGAAIKVENIKLVDEDGKPTKKNFVRAAVYCDNAGCLYTEAKVPGLGLPVLFVDEQIYHEVPSFLVATVDKFAMMPWLGDAGMLFGRATHVDDKRAYGVMDAPKVGARALPDGLLPPELIVQDELHLISGPLGTMVGLYETAVDYLCERPAYGQARSPKVLCSTATVRRAREQVQALFGRRMVLFPPRGITEGDNFFSLVERDEPGRLYVGVGAPGRALRAVSVRSYATLLAAARKHFDPRGDPKQPADPYMTLIGYFNSLRELGGMRRLVEDEVKNRVGDIESEKRPLTFIGPHPWAADRKLEMPAELTSRERTERVKETKRRLAARRTSKDPEPLDVVLASNMISVGLDIDRLGVMCVTGQPKTTSEYIQATSRVGRAYPGLVVTCLNVMRPRDRSHYERFVAYHESFYREVEATSVTPFSGQALDRGLVGSLLSMIRHGIRAMEPPRGVMNIHEQRPTANQIVASMVERARGHRNFPDDESETRIAELVQARGKSFLDAWEVVVDKAIKGASTRTYSKNDRAGNEGLPLLFTANDDPPVDHDARNFQVPTSMRDVEPSVHVWLRFKQLDERGA